MTDNVYAPPRANLDTQEGPQELWRMELKRLKRLYNASRTVHALGVLYALGAVGLIAALLFAASGSAKAAPAPGSLVIMLVIGLVYLAATVASFTRPRWGRWLGILICTIGLIGFPIGTIIGLFGLVAYVQGGRLFGSDRLTHNDVAAIYKQRKAAKT